MQPRDITGQRFGRLTAIERTERPPYYADKNAYWLCRCECGTEVKVPVQSLLRGKTKSCGCYRRDQMRTRRKGGLTYESVQS